MLSLQSEQPENDVNNAKTKLAANPFFITLTPYINES
jgi:hypothetical protein